MTENTKSFKTDEKRFEIKTLSPLHISHSQPWQRDIDYIYHDKSRTVFFIDYNHFLAQMDIEFLKNTDDMEAYKKKMLDMFHDRKLKILRQFSYPHPCAQIYPFIRDILSPLIPGSSVKGAIRTAILSQVIRKHIEKGIPVKTDPEEYLKKQFGSQTNNIKMSMDTIRITDYPFQQEKLAPLPFKTYSLNSNAFKEKTDKIRIEEAIPPGTRLNQALHIRWRFRETDKTEFKGIREIIDLAVTLREHYSKWIPQEIEFLEKYPSPDIKPVIDFYKSLEKKIEAGAILLHLGFGTGWESKTGAFLKENRYMWEKSIMDFLINPKTNQPMYSHLFNSILKNTRYFVCPVCQRNDSRLGIPEQFNSKVRCFNCEVEYSLDKLKVQYPFPKSRKFAYYKNQLFPPGWIELIPVEVRS